MVCKSDWIKVPISKEIKEEAEQLAMARNEKSKRFGQGLFVKTDRLKTGQDSHYLGALSELCVAKYFSCDMNKEIYSNKGDKHIGYDVVIKNRRIEIKLSTYFDDPFLRIPVREKIDNVDIFLLCTTDDEFLYIVGWATKEQVLNAKKKKFCRTCPMNYVLEEKDLLPIIELQ